MRRAAVRLGSALVATSLGLAVGCGGTEPIVVQEDEVFSLDEAAPVLEIALGLRVDGLVAEQVRHRLDLDFEVLSRSDGASLTVQLSNEREIVAGPAALTGDRPRLTVDDPFDCAETSCARDFTLRLEHGGEGAIDGRLTASLRFDDVDLSEEVEIAVEVEPLP